LWLECVGVVLAVLSVNTGLYVVFLRETVVIESDFCEKETGGQGGDQDRELEAYLNVRNKLMHEVFLTFQ
jgi:hypothetical protein